MKKETALNAIRGMVVNIPADILDKLRSSEMYPIRDPTPVMGALRAHEKTMIAESRTIAFFDFI
ncbi:hypothetical protein [Lentihominibacter hominis]|uniref:hypothetical protein n=1 Tax=Lentihominibacter hominis TaxID=2763645 RepID=UPI001FAB7B2D|nr:hypothetical protein [Lentihominibacter hominis]